ncbi:MAG: acyl carrier protein [Clostridia bacterium]|nr:acyl carrier protein [Clostridia bacterium]
MNTLEQLKAIVNDYKGEEVDLKEETTFEDLGFDSLDKVELVMQVESEFGIEIGADVAVNNIGELVAKIEELKK